MPESPQGPLFTENQIRLAFIASGVGMVSLLVLLLILASSQPQGRFAPADTSQYDATLERAAADLEGYRLLENGRATIDIERAMELVAERGVGLQLSAASTPADEAEAAPASEAPAEDAASEDAPTGESEEAAAPETATESATAEAATDVAEEDAAAEEAATAATEAATEEAAAEDATTGEADAATDAAAEPVAQSAGPLRDYDAALGEQTYTNCVGCHQGNGAGIAGVFPPLAGWTPTLVAADGGREYMVEVLLWGLQGEIVIEGQSYNGAMPAWNQLSDEQIAAVINHTLMSWGNADLLPDDFDLYVADDIAAQRDPQMSAAEVYEVRQGLELP